MPEQCAGDGKPLLLAAGNLDAAFADNCIEAAISASQKCLDGGLAQHVEALLVGGIGLHEEEVLAYRSREQLRILRDEADASAQAGRGIDLILERIPL